ncbi:MAG: hypothetical protein CTY16_15460 [Methylobacter sp.]|nr:MAG: hypothetical protein CTY16_15460 [Methylobacter sp.]
MKHICTNCHFFAKEYQDHAGHVYINCVSKEERTNANSGKRDFIKDMYSLNCHMGVWDEGINPDIENRVYRVSKINRKGKCFFFSYDPGMLFKAAQELQKREEEYRRTEKSNLYTRIGLWIASGALFANALIGIIRLYKDCL